MSNALDPARKGGRYAILFCGGRAERCHLNELEFCYRMLVDHYQFAPAHIRVLYFSGRREVSSSETVEHWPTEDSATRYRIKIDGEGTAENFRAVCEELQAARDDLVFVHISGHGDFVAASKESYLVAKGGKHYLASQFWNDLAKLPRHASLMVLMQQCFSAGFIHTAQQAHAVKAERIAIACASKGFSHQTEDALFNSFAWGWIAAHLNADHVGNALDVAAGASGFIEADDAFSYGLKMKHESDQPVASYFGHEARAIRLA